MAKDYKADVPESTTTRLAAVMDVFATAMQAVIGANPEVKAQLEDALWQWNGELENVDLEVQLDATSLALRVSLMRELLHGERKA